MRTEHTLTETFIRDLRWKLLRGILPVMMVAAGAGWYISGAGTDLLGILPMAIIVVLVVPLSVGFNIRRQVKSFRSLRITFDERSLTKTQDGYASMEIPLSEISAIEEVVGKGLLVRGQGSQKFIFLPDALDGFEVLRTRLVGICRPTNRPDRSGMMVKTTASLAAVACLVVFYRASSVPVILGTGTIIAAGLIWCFFMIVRTPHLDQRVKRGAWLVWLVVLSVGVRMGSALTDW